MRELVEFSYAAKRNSGQRSTKSQEKTNLKKLFGYTSCGRLNSDHGFDFNP